MIPCHACTMDADGAPLNTAFFNNSHEHSMHSVLMSEHAALGVNFGFRYSFTISFSEQLGNVFIFPHVAAV